MKGDQTSIRLTSPLAPSPAKKSGEFPPDIIRLLEILARIEQRRQERLRAIRETEKS